MRKNIFVTVALFALTNVAAFAQLGKDGYYRVQNASTGKYVGIIHDKSESEIVTTKADLASLRAYKNWDKVESDPATIVYFQRTDNGFNLHGQGTNTSTIIGYGMRIQDMGGTYRCYVVYNGTHYLSEKDSDIDKVAARLDINSSTRDWKIWPVTSTGDCYFGVKPTVEANGKYYATMYADWGFTPAASSTKAYYVEKVENGCAVIREITGAVAASTPVIFECGSAYAVDNKLDIAVNEASKPADNKLSGVYFSIDTGSSHHIDFVAYNPATMRVLGTCSDGRPGFVKKAASDFTVPDEYWTFMAEGAIPANTAYLVVPEGTPDELPLVTAEEYAAGIDDIKVDTNAASDIVTLSGVVVRRNATTVADLPAGIYIWNKRKVVVR